MPGPTPFASIEGVAVATSASPATQVLELNYATRWHLILKNASGGNLTAVRARYRTHANGPWTPWESVASGLPVAAGSTLSLSDGVSPARIAQAIEVELTAASSGSVECWLVGV